MASTLIYKKSGLRRHKYIRFNLILRKYDQTYDTFRKCIRNYIPNVLAQRTTPHRESSPYRTHKCIHSLQPHTREHSPAHVRLLVRPETGREFTNVICVRLLLCGECTEPHSCAVRRREYNQYSLRACVRACARDCCQSSA